MLLRGSGFKLMSPFGGRKISDDDEQGAKRPENSEPTHQAERLLPFDCAKPALMRERVNQPTVYSLGMCDTVFMVVIWNVAHLTPPSSATEAGEKRHEKQKRPHRQSLFAGARG